MINVRIIQLLEMVKSYPEMVANLDILNVISKARAAIKNKNDRRDYYSAFVEISTVMKNFNLAEKWRKFEDSKVMNLQFVVHKNGQAVVGIYRSITNTDLDSTSLLFTRFYARPDSNGSL